MLNTTQATFSNLRIYHFAKSGNNAGMENKEIRKANLESLYEKRQNESGMTKAQFAELIETSPAALSQLLGPNPNRNIGDRMARKIETTLNLPFGWMDVLHTSEKTSNVSFREINDAKGSYPVISWVSAGQWMEAVEPYHRRSIDRWYDTTVECSEDSFWLDVKGDSMTSPVGLSIPEGAAILVDPLVEPRNGKLVVAKLESDNEATFKKLVIDAGRRFLKPLNPQYPMLEVNGNCKIIGVVVDAKILNIP
ncbi:LexA family transcriptional regulator [Citrobacter sp. RHB20-C16]|uniref:LexA family protein n=1 Tax=unclassified Citrobacter TaxID=2644389 RepID=UPI0015EA782A|nr:MULTISPECIES: LexA family transcriptional regulator [unclassified Citrobacter]QMK77576.1 LexA family transcriptional regulator [Citrobacter sp. RHB20-C16]QMK82189.1 LexA family transcriptional regulator [Citrobacter sp. RHB20-C15]